MWTHLVDEYLRWLVRRGRAAGTIKGYMYGLGLFTEFCARESIMPDAITVADVQRFQDEVMSRPLAGQTRQLVATAIRTFLRWAAVHDKPVDPKVWLAVERPTVKRGLPRPLAERDLSRVLVALLPRPVHGGMKAFRDRALFLYLLATGARVSEVLQLDRDLFEEMAVVTQKGGTQKVLWANPTTLAAVADYLRVRKDNHPALWVTAPPYGERQPIHRLSPDGVRAIWQAFGGDLNPGRHR